MGTRRYSRSKPFSKKMGPKVWKSSDLEQQGLVELRPSMADSISSSQSSSKRPLGDALLSGTRLLLSDAQSMPSHTLAPGARETAPSPSYLERDLKIMVNFYLILFYATLILLSRQIDYYCRLDCLWKKKFKKEHEEFETMENVNRLLLENVLPAHVAAHFIGDKAAEDWYHQSYDCVCVMFASVPDFKVFYTECDVNKEGLECLRLLNEIIADFDELLLKPKFSGVEKIKTIGSTYMAAAGLSAPSGHENQDLERKHVHIGVLVEFSMALMSKLDGINRHSFNSFRLRVGINHGPVIAGVIGARKPQYDIWGNTVNVASRMESTGELGKIQVTEETCTILQGLGYSCECRGLINVKGRAFREMTKHPTPFWK